MIRQFIGGISLLSAILFCATTASAQHTAQRARIDIRYRTGGEIEVPAYLKPGIEAAMNQLIQVENRPALERAMQGRNYLNFTLLRDGLEQSQTTGATHTTAYISIEPGTAELQGGGTFVHVELAWGGQGASSSVGSIVLRIHPLSEDTRVAPEVLTAQEAAINGLRQRRMSSNSDVNSWNVLTMPAVEQTMVVEPSTPAGYSMLPMPIGSPLGNTIGAYAVELFFWPQIGNQGGRLTPISDIPADYRFSRVGSDRTQYEIPIDLYTALSYLSMAHRQTADGLDQAFNFVTWDPTQVRVEIAHDDYTSMSPERTAPKEKQFKVHTIQFTSINSPIGLPPSLHRPAAKPANSEVERLAELLSGPFATRQTELLQAAWAYKQQRLVLQLWAIVQTQTVPVEWSDAAKKFLAALIPETRQAFIGQIEQMVFEYENHSNEINYRRYFTLETISAQDRALLTSNEFLKIAVAVFRPDDSALDAPSVVAPSSDEVVRLTVQDVLQAMVGHPKAAAEVKTSLTAHLAEVKQRFASSVDILIGTLRHMEGDRDTTPEQIENLRALLADALLSPSGLELLPRLGLAAPVFSTTESGAAASTLLPSTKRALRGAAVARVAATSVPGMNSGQRAEWLLEQLRAPAGANLEGAADEQLTLAAFRATLNDFATVTIASTRGRVVELSRAVERLGLPGRK